ncbi:hypothetical protein L21SP5_02316 [Salinivirga cyanobacteriivorans]|uniref:Uncharacterized protein n=1 Tax=Salinivirga cyanobacteriivorans TaxID=1307839 RepID=A0A0S2I1P0_9BACT|nr:hypothetical protein L21SP5_02316 [Salinivirga cyanobacteriivorans]
MKKHVFITLFLFNFLFAGPVLAQEILNGGGYWFLTKLV